MKREYIEAEKVTERFEKAMSKLFRALKPAKYKPKKAAGGEEISRLVSHYWNRGAEVRRGACPFFRAV